MLAMTIYKLAWTACDDSGTLLWNSVGLGVLGISCCGAAIYGFISNLLCLPSMDEASDTSQVITTKIGA